MIEVVRTSSSWRDQERILDYFCEFHAEDAALRFLQAIDKTITFISEFPDLGTPWDSSNPRFAEMRFKPVPGFEKYLLLYRRYDQHALVLRILHASQNVDEFFR